MPPVPGFPQPRRAPRARRARAARACFAACALFAALPIPGLALAWESTLDPIFVFFPRNSCQGDRIALEVWRRDEGRWVEHPRHPVIPVDSCQLEDAGILLNEIRWRCLERDSPARDPEWSVGVRVFEPSVMQHCEVARTGDGFGETEIHISAPQPGETIRDADGNAEIEGSVRIGGLAGAQYDVVIAIDTSAEGLRDAREGATAMPSGEPAHSRPSLSDPLGAQVRAARAFVDALRDRLGEVRVGIVSFPGVDARPARRRADSGGATAAGNSAEGLARREHPLSSDAPALRRALERVLARGRAGPESFDAGLSLAIDELFRPPDWPGAARPGARRIVMLSADGSGGFPFGPSAQADRDFRERAVALARSASLRGVSMHLFAVGGISEAPPPFIEEMLAQGVSRFSRVRSPDREGFFADRVPLPYLESLSVREERTDRPIGHAVFSSDGRFAASVPLEPGRNHLIVRARTSDGDEREAALAIDFDARAYKDRLLAREAARIRRARNKHLVLEVTD